MRKRPLAGFSLLPVLLCAGCAAPATIAAYQTPSQIVRLEQEKRNTAISVTANGKAIPLAGFTTATIAGFWNTDAGNLFLIQGETPDCSLSYALLSVNAVGPKVSPVGHCGEHYAVTSLPHEVIVKALDKGASDDWVMRDGSVEEVTRERHASHARRKVAHGDQPDSEQTDYTSIPASLVPPAISQPVGENVIPQRVGGGPLPQGGVAAPTVFKEH